MKKKLISLCVIILSLGLQAHAELTYPYKTIVIDCSGGGNSVQLKWDFSKSALLSSVLVNGEEQIAGVQFEIARDYTKYQKEGVFELALTKEDDQETFTKTVSVKGKSEAMTCTKVNSWHILK